VIRSRSRSCLWPAPALALALVAARPTPAAASPLFELVGDAHGRGGLTARMNADGASAAYFNPALLGEADPSFDLGVFVVSDQIGITLDGRSSMAACADRACDVPAIDDRGPESFRHERNNTPISNPTVPTEWLQRGHGDLTARPRQDDGSGHNVRAYQTLGLVTHVMQGRLVLGLFAMIPLGKFTTAKAFYNDEREQYFSNSLHPELYSDRMTATSLAFGGGFRIRRNLLVGATFTLNLANQAAAPVYVSNLNDLDTVQLDSDIGVEASVAPHFGVVWDPISKLRLGATLHTPQSFEIDTGFNYILATGSEQSTTLHFVHSYMPLTVAGGASYDLGAVAGGRLAVTALATYARWSEYEDRHGERPSDAYRWSDIVSPAIGVRFRAEHMQAWVDALYQPTPVPPQTGRTNYVDNDRAGIAAGADYEISLWGSRFRVGADFIGHHLFERHQTKFMPDGTPADVDRVRDEIPNDSIDALGSPVEHREGLQTNNPGFPGFGSVGWILGGGVHVAVQY